jgi:RecA-family ATPase
VTETWPDPVFLTDEELRARALARAARREAEPSLVVPLVGGRRPEALATGKGTISATPYIWTDPTKIPRRDWLYSRHLIRAFVSALIAPGGVGKTSYTLVQALSIVSGKDLLGDNPFGRQLRVWLWNLEDPVEELTRRIQAAAMHYELTADDLGDRLFVDSGRDQRLVIATTTRDGAKIVRPVADSLVEEIKARRIDVLTIDPFVSCHEASENDNQAIDMIVKEWASIADRSGCAVQLVHHTRKASPGETEVTAESARGAKALTDACRSVQVINRMTKDEAGKAGVENHRLFSASSATRPISRRQSRSLIGTGWRASSSATA